MRWRWLGDGLLRLEPPTRRSACRACSCRRACTATRPRRSNAVDARARHRARCVAAALRLLVALGNPGAMRAGERYLDDDLNRLFGGRHAQLAASREAPRAAQLEAAAALFFSTAGRARGARWHIDMHTAIRTSVFEQFALLPHTGEPPTRTMFEWLGEAQIAAVLLHTTKGSTFSHFTAQACGALACTLELGKVMPFGANDLSRFAPADAAWRRLVSGRRDAPRGALAARVHGRRPDHEAKRCARNCSSRTTCRISRRSRAARCSRATATIATRCGTSRSASCLPNPSVKPGLRAGLLVIETTRDTHAALA
nr:succinylglutamate desuccinylase [Burkholderia mallei]